MPKQYYKTLGDPQLNERIAKYFESCRIEADLKMTHLAAGVGDGDGGGENIAEYVKLCGIYLADPLVILGKIAPTIKLRA